MVKRIKAGPIEAAMPAEMPGFIKPQLAMLKSKARPRGRRCPVPWQAGRE
jgi:hypothetical protein